MTFEKLEWDSKFFGFDVANLVIEENSAYNSLKLKNYILKYKCRLIQTCVNITDNRNINLMLSDDFEFVDLRISFILKIKDRISKNSSIRKATVKDIKALQKIAGSVFLKDSRFNHKNIDKKIVRKFYRIWAEKAVRGTFDDYCLVAEMEKKIKGFITMRKKGDRLIIGLLGVSEECFGQGVGSALIEGCLEAARRDRCDEVEVATEGKNIGAQNFYIKNGFKLLEIKSWYYKWIK